MWLYCSYHFPGQHTISFLFNVHTYYCAYGRSLVAFPCFLLCTFYCLLMHFSVWAVYISHFRVRLSALSLLLSSLGSFLATWSRALSYFLVYLCLVLSVLCDLWDLRSQVQGLNPGPWQWKLIPNHCTTGNSVSLFHYFLFFSLPV